MPIPIGLILAGASALGGILGTAGRRYIDPKWLEQHFGPGAVNEQTQALFNQLINSPYGRSMMSNAAEQGQSFSRAVTQQAAQAGLGGGSGDTSGTGIFATSAAQGATDSLQRGISSDFYQMAVPAAQQMVQSQLGAYLQANVPNWGNPMGGMPTPGSNVASQIGTAAGTIGAMLPQKSATTPRLTAESSTPEPANLLGNSSYLPSFNAPNPSFSMMGGTRMGSIPNNFGMVQKPMTPLG